jgi:two-component system cell cycle response regulator DivK
VPSHDKAPVVLLVDDVKDKREAQMQYFHYHGIETIGAADGASAIRIANAAKPAVIVLDLGLAGIDGWEVARRLKIDAGTRDIPIVALTGHDARESRMRALAAGVDACVTKPCFPEELLAAIRKYLGGSDGSNP